MKFHIEKKYLLLSLSLFFAFAGAIFFYYLLFHTNNLRTIFATAARIMMPITYGLILAYLLNPIVNGIEQHFLFYIFRIKRVEAGCKKAKKIRFISVFITILFVLFLIYLFFAMVVPQLIVSVQTIAVQFPEYVTNLQNFTAKLLENNPDLEKTTNELFTKYSTEVESFIDSRILPQINVYVSKITSTVFSSVVGVLKALWNFIIGMIIAVYLLLSKEEFAGQCKKMIYAFFQKENANGIIKNLRFVNSTFGGYISGKIMDSIIIGLLCFIGMTIMQLPYTMLISVIIGVTNIIPFFGPYIGAIPSAILILMVNPRQCITFVIFILILQQFDGNILGPKILGDKTGLSSFWVIFSITIFGGYFGILGMAIGVPVFALIYHGIKGLINRSLKKKNLSDDKNDYIYLSEIKEDQYIVLEEPNITLLNKKKLNDDMIKQSQAKNASKETKKAGKDNRDI